MIRLHSALLALALLAACDATPVVSQDDVSRADLQASDNGECWASETTPAVYETSMGHILVIPAEVAPDGTVLREAIYRPAPVPKVVVERGEIRFRVPCPHQMTPELIGSLQRALRVRGYFRSFTTSTYDAATRRGVRRYQKERGLDSDQLSLTTARELGLIAIDPTSLTE